MVAGYKDQFGIDIVNTFGSNEGMAIVSTSHDVPNAEERATCFPRFGHESYQGENRIGRQIVTKLVDPETKEEATTAGQRGEMLISGPTVFDGYFDSPEDNQKSFSKDGFFRSGDLFEITGKHGKLYRFVGRCKDIIVRGGVNISPEELDSVLASHPQIIECAVCGYPDAQMGEKVGLVAVPKEGQELSLSSVTGLLEDRGVAKFKWPEDMRTIDQLPRNPPEQD